jgi:hypothetical protein
MNKTFLVGLLIGLMIVGLFGCTATKKIFGKSANAENISRSQIVDIEKQEAKTAIKKLDRIGEYSYGISQVTNVPIPVTDLNERISSLANQPTEEAKKEMKKLVAELMSTNDILLLKKDKQIAELVHSENNLKSEKEELISDYMNLSAITAMQKDSLQSTLGQMDSWGGMGAIWYGIKRLIVRFAWGIGIFSVIFLILRILSMSNPIAASVFSIFNMMGSWLVNIIKVLVPKAVDIAGHVTTGLFNAYKSSLTKLVDAIQLAKLDAVKTGKPVDIKIVLDEVSKTMNSDEKDIINEIKKALNY